MNDQYLYHYTTPQGLIGIVKSKTLWATHTMYLNDTQEFVKGLNIAKRILDQLRNRETNEERIKKIEWLQKQVSIFSLSTFVASFSSEKDQLSQWRAYCREGGFTIGFPYEKIEQKAEEQAFSLMECIYKEEDQESLIYKAIWFKVSQWINNPNQLKEEVITYQDAERYKVGGDLLFELIKVCPLIKDSAFCEEKEWRLILNPGQKYESEKRGFFSRGSIIVPYIKFNLGEEIDFWGKTRVVVGASPHIEDSCESVKNLFRCYCGHTVCIEKTKIPYRHWW